MEHDSWSSVSHSSPCPICGKNSWCSVSSDGHTVNCRRESQDALLSKLDKNGCEFYIHKTQEGFNAPIKYARRPSTQPIPCADAKTLNRVYSRLLSHLTVSNDHYEALKNRGLSSSEIRLREYRTLPFEGRYNLADSLLEEFGEEICCKVPGIFFRLIRKVKIWSIHGCSGSGLLIPSRGDSGSIEALKIRPDLPTPGMKYLYLSSKSIGGAGPGARVHVPLFNGDQSNTVRLTEGELKSDIATALSGIHSISVPGVQSWRMAIPILQKLGTQKVRLAFDADASQNITVAKMLSNAATALQIEGFTLEVETWNQ